VLADRFWASVILFHLGVLWTTVRIGRHWPRRLAGSLNPTDWLLAGLGDSFLFGAATVLLGLASSLTPGFTLLRLLCQALFGEGVLLALWVALLHMRSAQLRRALAPAGIAIALLVVYWDAYHHEPHDLQVQHHEVDLSGGRVHGQLRILHLTDIQTPEVGAYEEDALRRGLAESPDMIVFTGDYIHERLAATGKKAAADLREMLHRIDCRAPLGVFATGGDAEVGGCESVFRGSSEVTCLDDRTVHIPLAGGRSLDVIGLTLDTSRGADKARIARLVETAPAADLRLVVGHRPDFVRALARREHVDLALAGHTHGGQVVLPLFGPPLTLSRLPRLYAADLHDYDGVSLHVSRGVGMERGTAPQIRFLCPPEICLLDVTY
jgi:predicted MPP superfamily phosphohydrolase